MRFLLTKIFFLYSISLMGQQEMTGMEVQQVLDALGAPYGPASNNVVRTFDYRFEGMKGSPFIPENWAEATLITDKNKRVSNVKVLYDVLDYQLWVERPNGIRMVANTQQVDSFMINNKGGIRTFVKVNDPTIEEKAVFLELMSEGEVNLYCKYRKYFVPGDRDNAAYNNQRYSEYKSGKSLYYIQRVGSDTFEKITPQKGKIFKALADKKDEIKAFIKENEFYIVDESNLVEIVRYYNTL